MRIFLTKKQADIVLESLAYSKLRIEERDEPIAEIKQRHLDEVDEVIKRVHTAQNGMAN